MTYLQLFQRFIRECSYTGSTPTTVVGVTGDRLQALDWLNDAYNDIQIHQTNWRFMKKDFSFTTTDGTRNYSVTTIGLTDFDRWKIHEFGDARLYVTSTGVSSEQYLEYLHWEDYRRNFVFGATRTAEGRPSYISIKPDNSLDLYLVPNSDDYTVVGQYYRSPAVLSADADEPLFPSQFHKIIIWRAMMFYGNFYNAPEKYDQGQNEYKKLLRRLQFDQLPKFTFGSPLA